jgi:pimeloyl-ACP methyl ester carboxylesterase
MATRTEAKQPMNGLDSPVIWVNVSPTLKRFDQPILRRLSRGTPILYWEYSQSRDEASSIQVAVGLLEQYICSLGQPVHLVGHGMGGVVALSYGRQFPDRVRSLSLLAVGPQPGMTWHTHYYAQRQLLPCTQTQILAQMACSLLGKTLPDWPMATVRALERDLELSPAPHSLYQISVLPEGGVEMPLLVCSGQADFVITPPLMQRWIEFFKTGDVFWQCPDGDHFFHQSSPELVANRLLQFWEQVEPQVLRHQVLVN